jgi:hypothetical protein
LQQAGEDLHIQLLNRPALLLLLLLLLSLLGLLLLLLLQLPQLLHAHNCQLLQTLAV